MVISILPIHLMSYPIDSKIIVASLIFGVYRLKPNGELTLLTKSIERPNGIGLSQTAVLYVAQSDPRKADWTSFEVQADGSLGEPRKLFDATQRVGKNLVCLMGWLSTVVGVYGLGPRWNLCADPQTGSTRRRLLERGPATAPSVLTAGSISRRILVCVAFRRWPRDYRSLT